MGGAGGVGGGAGGVGAGGAGVVKQGVEPVHVMLICIGNASCKFLSMLSNLNATPLQPTNGGSIIHTEQTYINISHHGI